jgi:hypothetical protein
MADNNLATDLRSEALARLSDVSPFTALAPHFGMLLGVEDLRVLQAYPRGKVRLHNSWLHGEGVVWGLDVLFNERGELEVTPGLALDLAGHELYLERSACVDLGRWFAVHRDDPEFDFTQDGDDFLLDLAVVARFKPCLSRPVPAIAAECAGSDAGTQFSRVKETVELLLRPIPEERAPTFPRLRVLFGHLVPVPGENAELDGIAANRAALLSASIPEQVAELKRLAALDVTKQGPSAADGNRSHFPEDPSEVLLAVISQLRVRPEGGGFVVVESGRPTPDVTVRPAHVSARTIQELLAPLCCGQVSEPPEPPEPTELEPAEPEPEPEPGEPTKEGGPVTESTVAARRSTRPSARPLSRSRGPRVVGVELSSRTIVLRFEGAVEPASAGPQAFSVTRFTSTDGWSEVEIKDTAVSEGQHSLVELHLKEDLVPSTVRLIARGGGSRPILGKRTLLPLGYEGSGAATGLDGSDFVFMQPFAGRATRR